MKEARFLYKCRKCGEIYGNCFSGETHAFRKLINASHNYKEASGNNIFLLSYHRCNDKEGGIGDLIGYEVEEKDEEEKNKEKNGINVEDVTVTGVTNGKIYELL